MSRRGDLGGFLIAAIILLFNGCAGSNPEAGERAAVRAARARFNGCLPKAEPEGSLRLAIVSVENLPEGTRVRLVAYAVGQTVDFNLPVYWMSRGQWLIEERARAYLLDGHCREYKLKDRKTTAGMTAPIDGRLQLKPGTAFETTLIFPALRDDSREGALIYDAHVLPFSLVADKPH
jgi:hypothetical protein